MRTINIHFICGHMVHIVWAPEDQEWQSEVECPDCAVREVERLEKEEQ